MLLFKQVALDSEPAKMGQSPLTMPSNETNPANHNQHYLPTNQSATHQPPTKQPPTHQPLSNQPSPHQPASPSFKACYNKGKWVGQEYVIESPEDDCRKYVSNFLHSLPHHSFLFLGDSTVSLLTKTMIANATRQCLIIKKCKASCSLLNYMDMPYDKDRILVKERQNPKVCNGCLNGLYSCGDKTVEFIKVYDAPDKMLANLKTNLTKFELFTAYLSKFPKDVCVANSGMWDLRKNITGERYATDVKSYITMLSLNCNRIIWISINAVLGDKKFKQSNDKILAWNKLVENMLRKDYPNVGYIDLYPMSVQKDYHVDNVHMKTVYYDKEASFFV